MCAFSSRAQQQAHCNVPQDGRLLTDPVLSYHILLYVQTSDNKVLISDAIK